MQVLFIIKGIEGRDGNERTQMGFEGCRGVGMIKEVKGKDGFLKGADGFLTIFFYLLR